tara:strand:+ start:2960 stop:3505 length:546 start_codon:yes stop_codon:yes gene_type:complete
MQNELGWEVTSLEMRRNGWELSSQVRTVREAIDNNGPFDLLMGSSFGGLAIANAVKGHSEDLRLVLLAPAFGVYDTLSRQIGDSELEEWKKAGVKTFLPPGWEEDVPIPWSFMEDARRLSWPEVNHRTVILHGLRDDVVPIESSRVFMRSSPLVEIVEVDDGHRLAESLELLRDVVSMVVD